MVLVGACAIFPLSPYIPSWLLSLTVGTTVGALSMLVIVLVVLQGDIVLGLATFLAVAALFLENRRRTVVKVTSMMTAEKTPLEIKELAPAPDLVPGEKHPAHDQGTSEEYGFEPTEESGTNKFDRVDDSQDNKDPLETVPPQPSEVSEMLQEKGLANI